jgi:hypothetical protein
MSIPVYVLLFFILYIVGAIVSSVILKIQDLGITYYRTIEDDYTGLAVMAIFWPACMPIVITMIACKFLWRII